DAEPISHELEAVRERERVLALVGEIDDGGAEDRPVAVNEDPACKPKLLFVAQILDARVDIAVEPQITDLRIGLRGAHRQVDFVPADREAALVDAIAMGELD